jgi:hypothetical protein
VGNAGIPAAAMVGVENLPSLILLSKTLI